MMTPDLPAVTRVARGPIRLQRSGARALRAVETWLGHSRQIDFWIRELHPAWSPTATRARVLDVIAETHDVTTFVLAPNSRWAGHRAGQFVPVEIEVDGVRMTRCYSLSSAPGDAHVSITVKRVPGGKVSSWMHEHLRRGDLVTLGDPAGELTVAPASGSGPAKLLLISGGSGVTPLMAILRDLARSGALHDVVFVHAARSARDVVFQRELAELAARHAGLRLVLLLDDRLERGERLDAAMLERIVPDLAERETRLCGPAGLMDALSPLWATLGIAHRLQMERFTPPPRPPRPATEPAKVSLALIRSGRTVTSDATGSLLEQLERAGERPVSGCRMGICNTCVCRKHAGITEDIRTGALSDEPDQDIRLCVARARTDVELAL